MISNVVVAIIAFILALIYSFKVGEFNTFIENLKKQIVDSARIR